MNFLPKDLEEIIVDYKNDLERYDNLKHFDLVALKLSYEKKLNSQLKKDKKNFEELFFFSQQLNKIKDILINKLDDSDYCNGCEGHHNQDFFVCEHCDNQYCDRHFGDFCFICESCDKIFCEDCGGNCNECGNHYCKECRKVTDDICDECFEEGCN